MKACYNIDVSREDHKIYPEYVCLKCFAQMCHIKAAKGTRYINPAVNLFHWQPHNDSCEVCEHFSKRMKGGRPKRAGKIEAVLQARRHLKLWHLSEGWLRSDWSQQLSTPLGFLSHRSTIPILCVPCASWWQMDQFSSRARDWCVLNALLKCCSPMVRVRVHVVPVVVLQQQVLTSGSVRAWW